MNGFTLGEYRSMDYGIIMTAPPKMVLAEADVETISVAGRSGDLVISKDRYKNVSVSYDCAILPEDDKTLREAALAAMPLLRPSPAYQRLVNTYHPDSYRLARVSGSVSIASIVEQAGTFAITFDCKPQRYLFSGLETLSFTSPGSINNSYMTALPLIKVYGSGDGQISVGGTVVQIIGQTDTITLDCDLQDAYYETGDGILENRNNQISAPKFPQLLPGVNAVSWSGGVERLEITPRWWTL